MHTKFASDVQLYRNRGLLQIMFTDEWTYQYFNVTEADRGKLWSIVTLVSYLSFHCFTLCFACSPVVSHRPSVVSHPFVLYFRYFALPLFLSFVVSYSLCFNSHCFILWFLCTFVVSKFRYIVLTLFHTFVVSYFRCFALLLLLNFAVLHFRCSTVAYPSSPIPIFLGTVFLSPMLFRTFVVSHLRCFVLALFHTFTVLYFRCFPLSLFRTFVPQSPCSPVLLKTLKWSINVGLALVKRCRRWNNGKPTLIQRIVSAGYAPQTHTSVLYFCCFALFRNFNVLYLKSLFCTFVLSLFRTRHTSIIIIK